MSGGCVCLPSEHERVNDLVSNLIRFEINWAFFTPSTVVLFQPSDVPGLRTLVVGGEPMKQEIVDMWAERLDLIQCSAPAETTVCMFQKMQSDTPRYHLGRAVGGIAWIVDPDNHHVLAPIGTVGELVIDGPVVARGYINKDDMKTGGFIKAPDWAAINGLLSIMLTTAPSNSLPVKMLKSNFGVNASKLARLSTTFKRSFSLRTLQSS
jgi:non-ribosomal peptide synthetase component F